MKLEPVVRDPREFSIYGAKLDESEASVSWVGGWKVPDAQAGRTESLVIGEIYPVKIYKIPPANDDARIW